jgi:hypothetical protein
LIEVINEIKCIHPVIDDIKKIKKKEIENPQGKYKTKNIIHNSYESN